MRIDKYLWCVRSFKTRSSAAEACKKGHVKINGTNAKPAKEVYVGEKISLRKNQINHELEVIDLPKSRVGAKQVDLYRKDNTPETAFAAQALLKFSKDHYRKKGSGRPTKKDRRNLEEYQSQQGVSSPKETKTDAP